MKFDARQFLEGLYRPWTADACGGVAAPPEPQTWAQRAAALLAMIDDADRRADLRERFEERAAVCEYDGNISRGEAEHEAYHELARAVDQHHPDTGNREP